MSDQTTAGMTNVIGYFNPNGWSVYIEISELNLKCELKPKQYIRDRNQTYINDPVFEAYVQPKGLSKATSPTPVPINYVPRFVKQARPLNSVTQATGFVRQSDGTVVPAYKQAPQVESGEPAANKVPIYGMTIAKARELGFIGKPRIVSEDYGIEDGTGMPAQTKDLPGIKYSIESPPRIKTSAPLTPELMEAEQNMSAQDVANRMRIQQSLTSAAAKAPAENFNPAAMRPAATAPVRMVPPSEPARISLAPVAGHAGHAPVIPQRIVPLRVAAVVQEDEETDAADQTGVVQELQEGEGMPEPTLDTPSSDQPEVSNAAEKSFVCMADGKGFKYRSELERYVKRKFPATANQLMQPYPPE